MSDQARERAEDTLRHDPHGNHRQLRAQKHARDVLALLAEKERLEQALVVYANEGFYNDHGALVVARPSTHPEGPNTYLDRGAFARAALASAIATEEQT